MRLRLRIVFCSLLLGQRATPPPQRAVLGTLTHRHLPMARLT